jgi:16S rRNA (guanine966-N2)-methyltransferase
MSRNSKPSPSVPAPPAATAQKSMPNRLRIIGGRWRGAKVTFPSLPSLRPSPDRVRETLFNWLQPVVVQARCLDLFAGSGALGIEALSRGAGHVDFVDSEAQIGRHLQETLQRLGAANGFVHVTDALRYLDKRPGQPYDIVFLDPPYASDLLPAICNKLSHAGWLAREALIYLECPADRPLPEVPGAWQIHRSKRAGQVGYHLLRA